MNGGAFSLDNPHALWGLVILLGFTLFRFILDRKYQGRRGLGFFALFTPSGLSAALGQNAGKRWAGKLRRRYRWSSAFFRLSLACLIVALSGPRWGTRIVPEYRRGLDVVLALDLSRSMEVQDIFFSRLERATEIGRETVENMGGVRFGAAVSRGRGVLAVPLTNDSGAALSFLSGLDASAITGSGTDLEALVDAAASAFPDSFPARRVIVLLSDGEALSGALSAAVDRAVAREITFAAVGIGSDEGGQVPGETDVPIISRRRPELLQSVAIKSGGLYIDGNSGEAPQILRSYLESLAFESEAGGGRSEGNPRWNLFVLAALLFLGASKICLMRPGSIGRDPYAAG
jgi:Ca-activated chloride channel family protein